MSDPISMVSPYSGERLRRRFTKWATEEEVSQFYGETIVPLMMRSTPGGEAIGGVAMIDGEVTAVAWIKGCMPTKRLLLAAHELCFLFEKFDRVVAHADPDLESADRMLKHLGFVDVGYGVYEFSGRPRRAMNAIGGVADFKKASDDEPFN